MRTRFLPFLATLLISGCVQWLPVPPEPPAPPTPKPAPPEPVPPAPDAETVPLWKWNAVVMGMPRGMVIDTMGRSFRSVTVEGEEVLVWKVASVTFGIVTGQVTFKSDGTVREKVLW